MRETESERGSTTTTCSAADPSASPSRRRELPDAVEAASFPPPAAGRPPPAPPLASARPPAPGPGPRELAAAAGTGSGQAGRGRRGESGPPGKRGGASARGEGKLRESGLFDLAPRGGWMGGRDGAREGPGQKAEVQKSGGLSDFSPIIRAKLYPIQAQLLI